MQSFLGVHLLGLVVAAVDAVAPAPVPAAGLGCKARLSFWQEYLRFLNADAVVYDASAALAIEFHHQQQQTNVPS